MDIPFPPNRKIIVPILNDINPVMSEPLDLSKPGLRIREFELQYHHGGPNGEADYLEKWIL